MEKRKPRKEAARGLAFLLFSLLRRPSETRRVWRASRSILNRLPGTPRALIYRQELRIFLFLWAREQKDRLRPAVYAACTQGFGESAPGEADE